LFSIRHIFCLFSSNHSYHDRLIDWLIDWLIMCIMPLIYYLLSLDEPFNAHIHELGLYVA
jgi:hypothetical protein